MAEAEEPHVWERLFTYHNQTWDQLDIKSDITEPSWFEWEKLEMQRKQTRKAQNSDRGNDESGSLMCKSSENRLKEGSTAPAGSPRRKSRLKMEKRVVQPHILIRILEMEPVMVTVMEMEILMEKRAVSPQILEISTEKWVAKPHLMKVTAMMMAMAMVMDFGKVGASEGASIGWRIIVLADWLGSGTFGRDMRICATFHMSSYSIPLPYWRISIKGFSA